MVTRAADKDAGVQKLAIESLGNEIRWAGVWAGVRGGRLVRGRGLLWAGQTSTGGGGGSRWREAGPATPARPPPARLHLNTQAGISCVRCIDGLH